MTATDELLGGTLIYLPPEAGDVDLPRFEPDNSWLTQASPAEQQAAMWRWMATHFEDPNTATPHDNQGHFDFLGDGPYLADEVIIERFEDIVPDAVIRDFIAKVQAEVGNEWAMKRLDKFSG
ncbi:MAG: hypothetical protein RLZZ618_1365 [Pseudomonadota bacterium]|jgi:hypothetical protein